MNKLLIVIFSIFCILLMYFISGPFDNFSNSVYFTSLIIQLISIYYVFSKENKGYSLNKTFYLFSLFFLGIAPLLQFYKGVNLWNSRPLNENDYIMLNIIIIIIIFLYQLFYNYFYSKKINKKNEKFIRNLNVDENLSHSRTLILILLSVISFVVLFYYNNYSIISMMVRGGELKESVEFSSSSRLIITNVFRPLTMMCLLYYITSKSNVFFVYLILITSTLITSSPFGTARFQAAAMYIPLLLLTISWLRKNNNFSLIFILGLLLVFPFLDNFRRFTPGEHLELGFDFNMFLQGHFDSYQNFALIVSENIVTWGRQLLGVIFFWIPRSVWPNKPIGSGHFLAEKQRLSYSNISCNYFAEGYINFGFLGVLIFIIALSYVTAKLDKMHWTISVHSNNNYFNVIYYVLIGMLFFVLRGDLLSSFAYTIGFLVSIWLVHKIVSLRFK